MSRSYRPMLRFLCKDADALLSALCADRPGRFSLRLEAPTLQSCQVIDNSLDSLWRSGRLLLRDESHLLLITPHSYLRFHVGEREVYFPGDIEDRDFRKELDKLPPLRSLTTCQWTPVYTRQGILRHNRTTKESNIRILALGDGPNLVELETRALTPKASKRLHKLLHHSDTLPPIKVPLMLPQYQARGYQANPGAPVTADMSVKTAATTMVRTYLAIARQNEAGICADTDTEYLHDYRVSLRRVRSIIALFKDCYDSRQQRALKAQLSELMRRTNRLRDLDVYLLEKSRDYALLPQSMHEGLDHVFSAFAQQRAGEQQALASWLCGSTYLKQIGALEQAFQKDTELLTGAMGDRNCSAYSARLIVRRYRKVCKIAAAIDEQTPDTEIHALRLECKKLRYLLDLAKPLFEARQIRKLIASLKRLQDNLGRFNDYSVQQVSLLEFLQERLRQDTEPDTAMVSAVGGLVAIKYVMQQHERALIIESIAAFRVPSNDRLIRAQFGGKF